ncbi:hypothetical protein RchiOBHm_Chr1g0345491 [Rosa chinensis]|uniref:Uncharacterized protein n=1 Tax=Rosa chinensis TaxID=74649 RepID=A0A2P6SES6_ROSCH|nr:hypothetical protein RchiOBHm_Chr1g0345491 [Rosa chinensis]
MGIDEQVCIFIGELEIDEQVLFSELRIENLVKFCFVMRIDEQVGFDEMEAGVFCSFILSNVFFQRFMIADGSYPFS